MKTTDLYSFIKKHYLTLLICLFAVAGLMLVGDMFSGEKKAENSLSEAEKYRDELEERVTFLVSKMEGVGRCIVMVTLETEGDGVDGTKTGVKGVAVLCEGAFNAKVKSEITALLSGFLGIPSSKISIGELRVDLLTAGLTSAETD